MSDAWEHAQELAERHAASGGLFVKLANDGDKIVGIFMGAPHARETHWDQDRYVDCSGKGDCGLCEAGTKASLRTAMNFYVGEEKAVKIVEGGVSWFNNLMKCRAKYGLTNWSFEIERHGAANDPRTTYTLLPHEQLTTEDLKLLGTLELHDLGDVLSREYDAPAPRRPEAKPPIDRNASVAKNGNLSVKLEVAERVKARLKQLPAVQVQAFLKRFGIARIRELSARDEDAAFAFLDLLSPASNAGIDPFL